MKLLRTKRLFLSHIVYRHACSVILSWFFQMDSLSSKDPIMNCYLMRMEFIIPYGKHRRNIIFESSEPNRGRNLELNNGTVQIDPCSISMGRDCNQIDYAFNLLLWIMEIFMAMEHRK